MIKFSEWMKLQEGGWMNDAQAAPRKKTPDEERGTRRQDAKGGAVSNAGPGGQMMGGVSAGTFMKKKMKKK